MGIFDKRSDVPRSQFNEILKKTDVKVPGRQLSGFERERIGKVDFPKKFGASISQGEYKRTLNRLKTQKRDEHDFVRKTKMGKEIKFLEGIEKQDNLPK
jgi:hypothetical protein